MKLLQTSALVLLAGFSASAFAADEGSVHYQCQSGKSVKVHYKFNDEGTPTSASAKLNGKSRTMRYDAGRSDDVETFFRDKNGYRLSAEKLTVFNYRQQPVMITSPNDNILYKGCMPSAKAAKNTNKDSGKASSGKGSGGKNQSVAYTCQGNRRLSVSYRFDARGTPQSATATVDGKAVTLNYDSVNSDGVESYFVGQGYRLGTGGMDAGNFRKTAIATLTSPNDDILYKSCTPN
ncbi:MAG: adhesin [Cardiobacteriaceae bacterium]|nr:adhesin [Cardiobacteriaceae bacterium]